MYSAGEGVGEVFWSRVGGSDRPSPPAGAPHCASQCGESGGARREAAGGTCSVWVGRCSFASSLPFTLEGASPAKLVSLLCRALQRSSSKPDTRVEPAGSLNSSPSPRSSLPETAPPLLVEDSDALTDGRWAWCLPVQSNKIWAPAQYVGRQ